MRRQGFTLIELLVVIAIISLLMGIILPSLGKARGTARRLKCMANLRSVAQGLAAYANDNSETYPSWSGWHVWMGDGTGDDDPGTGWTEQLGLSTREVYQDPARDAEQAPFCFFISARYTYLKYGVGNVSLRDSEVFWSSQFIMAGDCNSPQLYVPPYGTVRGRTRPDCDQDDATQPAVFFEGELEPHDRASNLAFHDGHASAHSTFEAGSMTFSAQKMRGWTESGG